MSLDQQEQQQQQQEQPQAREERVDTEEIHYENLRPMISSVKEPDDLDDNLEIPTNTPAENTNAKIEQFSTAVVMILAHIKEYQKGLEKEQENGVA